MVDNNSVLKVKFEQAHKQNFLWTGLRVLMQGINKLAQNGVRQEQCGPHTGGSMEVTQQKKKEKCTAPAQASKSVNMILGEELISETHLFFFSFIQPIFLKALAPSWEQDTLYSFKELVVNEYIICG